jgi:DDE family transposase
MATPCVPQLDFGFQAGTTVRFDGGSLTSDAGLLLLREFDDRFRLTADLGPAYEDPRRADRVEHSALALLRQRVYQIVAGYEDADDSDLLRTDPMLQTVVGQHDLAVPLGSQPTMSRLENAADWTSVERLKRLPLEWFLRARGTLRQELVLDVDSTDDPCHGQQQLSFFHGRYGQYVYEPLLIFEGGSGALLSTRLRRGNASPLDGLLPDLERIVVRLRAHSPRAPLALRADAGFAAPRLYQWLERHGLSYAIGFASNVRLKRLSAPLVARAQQRFERTGQLVRMFSSLRYRAARWRRARRVLIKVEVSALGLNVRYVVTNRPGKAGDVFAWYNGRGVAERYIDEIKNGFALDRLSCSRYRANALRVQLHALAYALVHLFRQRLADTPLARATVTTLRLQLFKVAARVERTARRLWFHLSSSWPHRGLFIAAHAAIRGAPA